MATYKAEFLAHYYGDRLRKPLQHYAFGFMDRFAHAASLIPGVTPRLANLPSRFQAHPTPSKPSWASRSSAGSRNSRRAAFSRARAQSGAASRSTTSRAEAPQEKRASPRRVLLWPDTWNNYYHPQSLHAAAQVLQAAGFVVEVPRHTSAAAVRSTTSDSSSRPARYLAKFSVQFAPQIDAGLPFVFLEPSCASVFRDELVNFFPTDDRAQRLREQTLLLSEFLADTRRTSSRRSSPAEESSSTVTAITNPS